MVPRIDNALCRVGEIYSFQSSILWMHLQIRLEQRSMNEFRKVVQDVIDGAARLGVDLDGQSLKDLRAFRIQSSVFDFTLPNDNVFDPPAGTYFTAVDDGVYLMLKPLSPGSHLLHFAGSFPASHFTLDITYHLKVSP
jgi:hypothetical protein